MSRLYLLDDHAIMRDGLRAVLQAAGHVVVGEGDDATVCVAEIARLQPQVVLLDLNLAKGGTGLDVLQLLRARCLAAHVLVLTMSGEPRNVTQALALGALGYVLKGSPAAELLRAVEAVAAGRGHLGPGVSQLLVRDLARPAPEEDMLAVLSVRERQIMRLVVQGDTSAAIASRLHLSPKTVDTYRSRLMAKLGVADVVALVRMAVQAGLVDDT